MSIKGYVRRCRPGHEEVALTIIKTPRRRFRLLDCHLFWYLVVKVFIIKEGFINFTVEIGQAEIEISLDGRVDDVVIKTTDGSTSCSHRAVTYV